jgi:hypothetical protein
VRRQHEPSPLGKPETPLLLEKAIVRQEEGIGIEALAQGSSSPQQVKRELPVLVTHGLWFNSTRATHSTEIPLTLGASVPRISPATTSAADLSIAGNALV